MTNNNQTDTPPEMSSGSQPADERKKDIPGNHLDKSVNAKKKQRYRASIRIILYIFLTLSGAITIALASARAYIDASFIASHLKAILAQQTGSRIEFDSIKFDVLTGIDLLGVRIYPPERGSRSKLPRGHLQEPAFICDKIEAKYTLLGLLAGQLNIRAIRFVHPQIKIKKDAHGSNVDGISEFRQALNDEDEPREDSSDIENDTPSPGSFEFLKSFDPSLFYMPFKIVIRNVGIQDFGLNIIDSSIPGRISETFLSGLGVDIGVLWAGSQSDIWAAFGSGYDAPFHLQKIEKVIGKGGSSKVKQQLNFEAAVKGRVHVKDLSILSLDFATRIVDETSMGIPKLNAPILGGLNVNINFHGLMVNIQKIFVEIPYMVSFDAYGTFGLPREEVPTIGIDIRQKFEIDLAPIAEFSKQFIENFEASGKIKSAELYITGRLNPKDPQSILEYGKDLPRMGGSILFDKIKLVTPKPALNIQALSGELKLGADSAVGMKGLGLEADLRIHLDNAELLSSLGKENPLRFSLRDFSSQVSGRLIWPLSKLKMAHVSIGAKSFAFNKNDTTRLEAPLRIELKADGEGDISRAHFAGNVDWVGLAQSSLSVDCTLACRNFRISSQMKLNAIEKLYIAGKPLMERFIPDSLKPGIIKGNIESQINMHGTIPDPRKSSFDQVFSKGNVNFDSRIVLDKIDLSIPLKNLELSGSGVRIQAKGNFDEQRLSIATELNRTKLVPRQRKSIGETGSGKVSLGVLELKKISGSLDFFNKISKKETLRQSIESSQTNLNIKFQLGSIQGIEILDSLLDGSQFELNVSQNNFRYVNVKNIGLRMPKLGALSSFSGETSLDGQHMPLSMVGEARMELSQMDRRKFLTSIKSSGGARATIQLATSDLKKFGLNGLAEFDDFSLEIDGVNQSEKNKVKLEKMSGKIPISQIFNFPIKQLLNNSEKTSISSEIVGNDPYGKDLNKNSNDLVSENDLEQSLLTGVQSYLAKKASDSETKVSKGSRVDYGSLKIFYPQKKPIKIARLITPNIELSDILVDLDIRQDLFSVNEYEFEVIGGRIHGDLQVDFAIDPDLLMSRTRKPTDFIKQISTNMQVTRLDTRRLLDHIPGASLSGKSGLTFFSNPYLDATMRTRWNTETSDVSGAIDITTIGKEQMRILLSYIDPQDENPTIVDIRKALMVGEVRKVSIPMRNGEIGLEVDIRALGLPLPTPSLSRFPMSQILDNFKRSPGQQSKKEGVPS